MIDLDHIKIIRDGRIHRFKINGDKPGTKNGWYIAKTTGFIIYGSWKDQSKKYYINKNGEKMNYIDYRNTLAQYKQQRINQDVAALDLDYVLTNSTTKRHGYLETKGFPYNEALVYKNCLIVPIYDYGFVEPKLVSLQYIDHEGRKKFARGCRFSGGMHFLSLQGKTDKIFVCEGYATALSIALATDEIVACCFAVKNLEPAVKLLVNKYDSYKIIVCADDDHKTAGNPGVTESTRVAKKYNVALCIPDVKKCSTQATDFNDIMVELSLNECRRQLAADRYLYPWETSVK